jgi:hypothetical protein
MPDNTPDDLALGVERLHMPKRLVSAREIAATEKVWSSARAVAIDGEDFDSVDLAQRIERMSVHRAFYELVEVQGAESGDADVILELFAENADLPNATLERIEMNGRWDEADGFERNLLGLIYDTGYKGSINRIARESSEARRSVTIPAGFTKEHGFVALRRKRTLIVATHVDGNAAPRPKIEIDKVSTFALDISKLSHMSDPAAKEVRLIVASTIFKAINWQVLEARITGDQDATTRVFMDANAEAIDAYLRYRTTTSAKDARGVSGFSMRQPNTDTEFESALQDYVNLEAMMRRNGISLEEVEHRAYKVDEAAALHDAEGLTFIEEALKTRSELLTPAATTYYVHS